MKILVSILVLVAFVIGAEAWFDCRRAGQECRDFMECDFTNGTCSCSNADMEGEDCKFNTTLETGGCDPPCENGGRCYNESDNLMCYCPSDFTGSACQFKRAAVECSGSAMNITIRPFPGFSGSIYVLGNASDSQCTLQETSSGSSVFTASLSLEGPECSPIIKNNTPNENDTTYEREIFVQYSQFFQTSADQLVTIGCTIQAPDVSAVNGTFGSVATEGGDFDKKKASATLDPVKFVVEKADGTPIIPPSKVGENLRLYFTLKDKKAFPRFLVEKCEVHNGLLDTDRRSMLIIKGGCLTQESKSIIRGLLKFDPNVPSVELPFGAFKFQNSPDIAFTCDVRVCKAGDSKCDKRSCSFGQGYGRRRRDVTSDLASNGGERTVEQKITVVEVDNPYGLVTAPQQAEETSCFGKPEVLTVVTVLGALCLMLMLLGAILATRRFRRTGGSASQKELDSQSTYCSSLSSSQLHIPRVKASM